MFHLSRILALVISKVFHLVSTRRGLCPASAGQSGISCDQIYRSNLQKLHSSGSIGDNALEAAHGETAKASMIDMNISTKKHDVCRLHAYCFQTGN